MVRPHDVHLSELVERASDEAVAAKGSVGITGEVERDDRDDRLTRCRLERDAGRLVLDLRVGHLRVGACCTVQRPNLHLDASEQVLVALGVVGRPHEQLVIEQIKHLDHPNPLVRVRHTACVGVEAHHG